MSLNLVLAQVILLMLGLIGISTAEPNMIPDHASKIVVALLVTFALSRLRPKAFLSMGTVVWVVTLILLALVLVIGVGTELSPGTKRWLRIPGFQFQPSEFAKLGLILQIASFFARRGVQHKLLSATLMIGLSTLLVLLEPDLGSTVLIFSLGIVLMYAAGVKMNNIGGLLLGIFLIALPFGSLYLERHPYILARATSHFGDDVQPGLTQIGMAHRDLGYGGLWGQGPDGLRYTYFADHTDAIAATVGFSTGLLGVTMLIFAYWLVVSAALQVSEMASRVRPMTPQVHGASILATGAMYMVVGQAVVNLAVVAGIFPVTGVPLPLVSYGFSSMLTMSAALALIHSALREVRRHLPEDAAGALPGAAPTPPEGAPVPTLSPNAGD
ncbi:FtsW/RodA/SpoVE family cell cycle protein [Deinococcus aquiradiocola]|uniref:Cell division protein FtsW n=1 Tax=Deinococcus aquiradiocola TaxID=393059 RepID=A0A917PF27_9DEIO|nr:FtsW/RodA/SpoVE family cell cycle protein [Deinococcus aquiradiocola]GGJ73415.1 cell division protein FtsW [Deinococcus aquiradiocola]